MGPHGKKSHCSVPRQSDVRGHAAALSRSSSFAFRRAPQRYPESDPSERMTRWQGTARAIGLRAHACATARTARGRPMRRASSAYVTVCPAGIFLKHCQTRRWKAVPRRSSGTSTRASGRSRRRRTVVIAPPRRDGSQVRSSSGKRRSCRRPATSVAGSSPRATAQMPASDDATRTDPKRQLPTANRMHTGPW